MNAKQESINEELIHVKLYNEIEHYYTLIIRAMSLEDFETVKKTLDFDGTYENHIESLMSELKPKDETLQHILDFITLYPEFKEERYLEIIKYVNRIIETNPSRLKQEAYKKLLEYANDLKQGRQSEDSDSENNDGDLKEENQGNQGNNENNEAEIDDEIHVTVGNSNITLKTFQDPLIIHLYSIVFTAFSAIHKV